VADGCLAPDRRGRLRSFGKSTLDKDRYIRTLGWRQAAQRDLDAMSDDTRAILSAYAAGVNAWIDEHNGRLSMPFVVAGLLSGSGGIGGLTLEHWTPLDTATWQKVQAWSLGGNVDTEIFRLRADAKLGSPARTDELFPAYDPAMPVITASDAIGEGGRTAAPPSASVAAPRTADSAGAPPAISGDEDAALGDLAGLGRDLAARRSRPRRRPRGSHGVGSNNWVVSGDRTQSGKPILANDPHLGFGMPSVWIMNGLHCREVSDGCPGTSSA
jgi:penicillin amidase